MMVWVGEFAVDLEARTVTHDSGVVATFGPVSPGDAGTPICVAGLRNYPGTSDQFFGVVREVARLTGIATPQ